MNSGISFDKAFELLNKYNKEEFHILHSKTVSLLLEYFANIYDKDNSEYWKIAGLLHDIDYEMYPEMHCVKCVDLMKDGGCSDELIHSVCSHGYGLCCDVEPNYFMEKVLFAVDELSGLIWAAKKMRPSNSCKDMEVQSLKKKFKDKKFAAGCSRDVISKGAEILGWDLDRLLSETLEGMKSIEDMLNS